MNIKKADNLCVSMGSALLDFTFQVEENILSELNLIKGHMHLIDDKQSREIFKRVSNLDVEITPGESAANVAAGVAYLGGKSAFMGSVGNDEHGALYINETRKSGVDVIINTYDQLTGHAITFITPDSERTFATHLGAALCFSENDVSEKDIASSSVLHIEGYMLEADFTYSACIKAMDFAVNSKTLISVDLSDPALINRIKERLEFVLEKYVDIVFVNEEEAVAFTGKQQKDALRELAKYAGLSIVKLGAQGSLISYEGSEYEIKPVTANVMNTNGAGDMYAASIIYGITSNLDIIESGNLASKNSALVVSQIGARLT
jgi:sugar/nucleoside kinase (ribokinase family)